MVTSCHLLLVRIKCRTYIFCIHYLAQDTLFFTWQIWNPLYTWKSRMPFHCNQSRCSWTHDWLTRMARFFSVLSFRKERCTYIMWTLGFTVGFPLLGFRCWMHGSCYLWNHPEGAYCSWKAINFSHGLLIKEVRNLIKATLSRITHICTMYLCSIFVYLHTLFFKKKVIKKKSSSEMSIDLNPYS